MSLLRRKLEFGEEKLAIKKAMGKMRKIKRVKRAPEGSSFLVHDGPELKSIKDLYIALEKISKQQFEFHVKRNGNDFAKWIEGVFDEKKLAAKVAKLKSKKGIKNAIEKFLID